MRRTILAVLSAALLSGCATKGFVTEGDADVGAQITALERALDESEATIELRRPSFARSTGRPTTPLRWPGRRRPQRVRLRRRSMTSCAGRRDRAREPTPGVRVVIADNHDAFAFADVNLPDSARATLDRFVDELRQLPTASYIEIEGHTDASGPAPYNARLGLERAESVRRYLHQQHQLPLHKMSVISYGEDQPVAPNDDLEGRARNRRVVVRVLG